MTYDLIIEYQGFNPALEAEIEKVLDQTCPDRGSLNHTRDLNFTFDKRAAAQKAFKKINAMARSKRLSDYRIQVKVCECREE